ADAAALLLPSMSAVEVVDQKIRMLRYSDNAVAKRIGYLAVEPSDGWASTVVTDSLETIEAKIIIVLMRGEYDLAFSLLSKTSLDAQPKRALRLALRKELRLQQNQDA